MKRNDWQKRFGAKRRTKDRELLAEAERRIAAEEKDDERARIARAFGRDIWRRI